MTNGLKIDFPRPPRPSTAPHKRVGTATREVHREPGKVATNGRGVCRMGDWLAALCGGDPANSDTKTTPGRERPRPYTAEPSRLRPWQRGRCANPPVPAG